jgi:ankyrin repeat protein
MKASTIQSLQDNIFAIELNLQDRPPNNTDDALIEFESKLTLKELKDCLAVVADDQSHLEQSLKNLLAARWERIRKTPSCYTQAPFNPVNCLCLELANILAPLPNEPDEIDNLLINQGPYFLLMPSLAAAKDISGANIHQYKLHQFVLSDDERLFMPLQLCLNYAVDRQQDIMHAVSTVESAGLADYEKLSPTEIERISNHSTVAQEYLASILSLQKERQQANDLGPQLSRLVEALRNGGAKKRGQEYDSGAPANEGIVAFSKYWDTLSKEQQDATYKKYPVLKDLIGRLMRPNAANYRETTFCVEIIANGIEDLVSRNNISTVNIKDLETACRLKKEKFENLFLKEHGYTLLPSKAKFSKILPLLFQLPANEQFTIFKNTGNIDAWMYALEYAPSVVEEFRPLLTESDKNRAKSLKLKNGLSPLILATEAGCVNAVSLLLDCGVNINEVDHQGYTALMKAAQKGHLEIVTRLLDSNADLNYRNKLNSDTALTLAIASGQRSIVDHLLSKNANIFFSSAYLTSNNSRNPLQIAIALHPELIEPILRKAITLPFGDQETFFRNLGGTPSTNVLNYAALNQPLLFSALLKEAVNTKSSHLLNATHFHSASYGLRTSVTTLNLATIYGDDESICALINSGLVTTNQTTFDHERHTPLTRTAMRGKVDAVNLLLDKNPSLINTAEGVKRNTALNWAIIHGQRAVVDALLAKNAMINLRNTSNQNAIDLAMVHHPELLEPLLLKAISMEPNQQKELVSNIRQSRTYQNILEFVSINKPTLISSLLKETIKQKNNGILNTKHAIFSQDYRPHLVSTFALAALYGDPSIVQELLDAGVQIDPEAPEELSALMVAAMNGKLDMVTFLLGKNASIDKQNRDKNTALHLAIIGQQLPVVEALLTNNATLTTRNVHGYNAFDLAKSNIELLKPLLLKAITLDLTQQKELLKSCYPKVENVLCFAAENCSSSVFSSILKEAIRTNASSILNATHCNAYQNSKQSTLALAAMHGDSEVVLELLNAGVEINANQGGYTALGAAAMKGNLENVTLLLSKNASTETLNQGGDTALNLAVDKGHCSVVEALLSKNATLDIRNIHNVNAIDIAITKGHPAIIQTLLQKAITLSLAEQKELLKNISPKVDDVLSFAATKQPNLFHSLLKTAIKSKNLSVLNATHTVYTPANPPMELTTLNLAALYGNVGSVQEILTLEDVDINATTENGLTALNMAEIAKKEEIIALLIERGARVNLNGNQVKKAIHWEGNHPHRSIVNVLQRKGIDAHHHLTGKAVVKNATLTFSPNERKISMDLTGNALHLKSHAELNTIIASIPAAVTHVALDESGFVAKERLADTDTMLLDAINFNAHLALFKTMERKLRKKCESAGTLLAKNNKNKPTYQAGADAATALCQKLTSAQEVFIRTHDKPQFFIACEQAIHGAHELTNHRGFKLAFAEFMRDLLALISKKAVTYLNNKYHLFAPKTNSHKKLDKFGQATLIEKTRHGL